MGRKWTNKLELHAQIFILSDKIYDPDSGVIQAYILRTLEGYVLSLEDIFWFQDDTLIILLMVAFKTLIALESIMNLLGSKLCADT